MEKLLYLNKLLIIIILELSSRYLLFIKNVVIKRTLYLIIYNVKLISMVMNAKSVSNIVIINLYLHFKNLTTLGTFYVE